MSRASSAWIAAFVVVSLAVAGQAEATVIVHQYDFEGNGQDAVGSAHLTNTGGSFVPGVSGQAFRFDNDDTGANPPATQYAAALDFDFDPIDPLNWGFSVSVRFDSLPSGTNLDSEAGIISIGPLTSSNNLWLYTENGIFTIRQQNRVGAFGLGTTMITTGTWYDIEVTVSSDRVRLFVNGTEEASFATAATGIDPDAGIVVGAMSFDNIAGLVAARGADGAVDNFMIYNIPEPASLALIGLGTGLLLTRRRAGDKH